MRRAGRIGSSRLASIGAAILAFAVLSALSVVIFRGMRERDRLESRNDAERTMNLLLASLRDHDDFGSAIEANSSLEDKVVGVGVYAEGGERLYGWGDTPITFARQLPEEEKFGEPVRKYIENPRNDSLVLLLHPFRVAPPPGGPRPSGKAEEARKAEGPAAPAAQAATTAQGGAASPQGGSASTQGGAASTQGGAASAGEEKQDRRGFLFTTLRKGEVVYLEIREPAYWARYRFETILFPVIELILAALVVFVRGLILRNEEYRGRIEEQKNLVVLGTAASTLAHEIKNPLLSIRLQTRILEKTCPPEAMREIGIINDEVERLSALSHRVGDYLRDPAGNPRLLDPSDVALEVGMRLCGRNILKLPESAPQVSMDPERLRSILENLLRNALEAGGPEEGVSIEVGALESQARIDVLDRGSGLSSEAEGRLFDPFFTTKSRGTGIGLSVCQRFAQAAGGSITLSNRPGGGCRARLLLPAAEAKE